MRSRPARHRYCRCGTHLAADNTEQQCARCQRASRDKLIAPPQVPVEFWQAEQFHEAFATQHIGRMSGAYRTHPHHHAAYGPSGISQTLLGHWLGLRQPQISRSSKQPIDPEPVDIMEPWELADALTRSMISMTILERPWSRSSKPRSAMLPAILALRRPHYFPRSPVRAGDCARCSAIRSGYRCGSGPWHCWVYLPGWPATCGWIWVRTIGRVDSST